MTKQSNTESTSLIVIQPTDVRAFFVEGKDVDLILSKIETLATDFVPDVTTEKGRKLIASKARSAASSKVYIDNIGKELNDEEKETPKRIDATRKRVRDHLDDLRDRVRQPLTDYENAEKARIAALDQRLNEIHQIGSVAGLDILPSKTITAWIGKLDAVAINDTWDEYQERATLAKESAKVKLESFLQTRITWESQQAEIARLKAEQEEKDRIQREKEIADQARHEAEQKALREKLESEQREQAAKDALLKAKQDAIDAKLKAEQDAKDAQQRLEQERKDAEERQRLAVQQAADQERQRQVNEQNRIALEDEQSKAEAAAKSANIEHQKEVHNEILSDLIFAAKAKGFDLSVDVAKGIISSIATGKIRHTRIEY